MQITPKELATRINGASMDEIEDILILADQLSEDAFSGGDEASCRAFLSIAALCDTLLS